MKFLIMLITIIVLISLNVQIAKATSIKKQNTNLLKAIYKCAWKAKKDEIINNVVEEKIVIVDEREIIDQNLDSKNIILKKNQNSVFSLFNSAENGEVSIDSIYTQKVIFNDKVESSKINENDLERMKKIAENTNKGLNICKKKVLNAQ